MKRLLGILFVCYTCLSFNLDPRIPIIKTGQGDYPDRFFGYSVAQHRTQDGKPYLLVGAPQDQNLQPSTNRSGALWKCELTAKIRDCEQVPTDGKRENNMTDRKYYGSYRGGISDLLPPLTSEIKDGQWLGVQVASQGIGGKVIVCAHRYTVRDTKKRSHAILDNKRGMLGMCYVLESDLTLPINDNIGYKSVINIRDAMTGPRLEVKDDFDDHAKWGVCQIGTAASFVRRNNENKSSKDYALFGAPGCFTWRGNVFGSSVGSIRRREVAIDANNEDVYDKHGHLGLSVSSGRFFQTDLHFVSGAPHAGKTGSIYFFKKNQPSSFEMEGHLTLSGEVFGEGFGHSLVTLDANGDTLSDLLVGAPFHEEGSVYLYPSSPKTKGSLDKGKIKILGTKLMSQFGLAITDVGDLNRDGFEDFAVGAPYEKEEGGAVYIFFGGPQGIRKADKVVKAKEIAEQIIYGNQFHSFYSAKISTFGSSLSGGMDLDNNGYPDLLIGAYSSNHVVLLKARPIIDIITSVDETNLLGIDPGAIGCPEDAQSKESCFAFKTCFEVVDKDPSSRLNLSFVIETEPNKMVSRVVLRLKENHENRSRTITDTIVIGETPEHCSEIIGYVGSLHADISTPVKFSMSYTLIQKEPVFSTTEPHPSINDYPILNQAQAKKTFQATFEKGCGEDDICQSAIKITPVLRDKLYNELSKTQNIDGFYTLELGSLRGGELILDVLIENRGEAAYESSFHVHFPNNAVSYIGLSEDSELNAPVMKNSSWLSFNSGNPFKNTKNGTRTKLRFQLQNSVEDKIIQFYLNAETTSSQVVDPSTYVDLVIVTRAEVKVIGAGSPAVIYYGGKRPIEVKGESALSTTGEIGPQIVHKYQVINGGPSRVSVVTVQVDWPFQVENGKPQGKWLLYLTEEPILKNGKGYCVLPPGVLSNPLNYTLTERSKKRTKREIEEIVLPSYYDPEKGIRIFTFDCNRGTAKCINITCQIYDLGNQESVTILIKSRLWNGTLEEDYNLDFDSSEEVKAEVFSKAKVILDGDVSQNVADDYFAIRTVAERIPFVSVENDLPWWVILIAVLAGLLLLVIICLVLRKIGFFKRKRISEEEDDSDFLMSAHFEKTTFD